jgi:hypothetical protein
VPDDRTIGAAVVRHVGDDHEPHRANPAYRTYQRVDRVHCVSDDMLRTCESTVCTVRRRS